VTTLSTKPPSGTRDFLPEDIRKRQYVTGVIREVYESYGYEPLETPAFENIETLLGKYGDEGNKLIFKILKRGEHEQTGQADLALRYDLTVPLARVVAQYQNALPKFFKRYQIQPVWRADRPARGRFREFYQCDVDAIGSTSPIVEAEQLAAMATVLERLAFTDAVIQLNHRALLTALIDVAGIPRALEGEALVALDKLDKIGRDGVVSEMSARGFPATAGPALLDLVASSDASQGGSEAAGGNDWVLERLERSVAGHETGARALQDLKDILRLVAGTAAAARVNLAPSLARGLSYYTGAIMEATVEGIGSLGGGGRYDGLIGMFLGRDVPACGFSLGLERILVVMSERDQFPPDVSSGAVDILVTLWDATTAQHALRLAADLRAGGLRVEVYPEADKLGKQFKYAAGRNVAFVAIEGDEERTGGTVAIKDLRSGEQTAVARNEAAAFVAQRLHSRPRH
jgi:histidyl-tRNA synthetase